MLLKYLFFINYSFSNYLDYNLPYNKNEIFETQNKSIKKIKTKDSYIQDIMRKFTSSMCLSILTSLLVHNQFKGLNIYRSTIGASIIFLVIQLIFNLSFFLENSLFTIILFYLKSLCFGLIISLIFHIYSPEKILLALISTMLIFGLSFMFAYFFEEDLTNIKNIILISIVAISLMLVLSIGIKFLINSPNINKYINSVSIFFSIISIISSVTIITYTINQLKLNNNNFINRDLNTYMYYSADILIQNFIHIFFELLNTISKNQQEK